MADKKNDNPIQPHYDKMFNGNGVNKKETAGDTNTSIDPGSDVNDVKNAEETPNKNWDTKVVGPSSPIKSGRLMNVIKKKSPMLAILMTLVGGLIGFTMVSGPAMLIVHVKEVMLERFDTQFVSMDVRTRKLLTAKTTGGICTKKVAIGCKYSTLSDKQIKNFDKAGIKVNSAKKTVFGRSKPTSFEFEGKTILAKDFVKQLDKNPGFGAAIKRAYNPRFAGFSDYISTKVFKKRGLSKKAAKIDGETDSQRLKSIQDNVKNSTDSDRATPKTVKEGDDMGKGDGSKYSAEDAKAANKAAAEAADIANELADNAANAAKVGKKAAIGGVTNVFKISGYGDNLCLLYGTTQSVGYAAKMVRTGQMAAFAMIFLNIADQIKAGEAKTEDVAYIGMLLTAAAAGSKLTATNSLGYRYAANGEKGKLTASATQYMAGGGLGGKFTGLTAMINKGLNGTPKTTCKFLGNPIVGAASLVGGIALMIIPGVNVAITPKMVGQAVLSGLVVAAAATLPALLQNIIAGTLIDDTTVGEEVGDAIASGSSGIMSNLAQAGGNAPLTPTQAVAYRSLSNDIAARYAEEDRLTHSPFDITNKNTFFGKITRQLIPYASNMSTVPGALSSMASMMTKPLSALAPQVNATSTDEYTMCEDLDYSDLDGGGGNKDDRIATDPFCNVVYGIPPDILNSLDPTEVAEALGDEIDQKTGDPVQGSGYDTFMNNCVNRERPLGDAGVDGSTSDGTECLIDANPKNKYYYVHLIDQRAEEGMDTDFSETTGSSEATPSAVDAGTVKYCTENYEKYSSQSELKSIFGSSESAVSKHIVDVEFPMKKGTKKIKMHDKAAPCLKAVAQDLASVKHRPTSFDGSFVWRPNRNNPSSLSYHSFGIALDFDAGKNPNGGGRPGNCTTNMPDDFVAVFKKYGFRWGGNYKSTCDAMHFEWMGGSK